MKPLELLAPAKNLQQGMAAVNYGADAVYVGAPMFGARASVGVNVNDIEALARFAHRYNAKVYTALNTILFDDELEKARKIIYQMYEAGVDALIIQDMGILEMDLPPIPLHASTQANNRTLEHIRFLDQVGFERVILARELDLKSIQNIHENTNVELEAFVHGALCVSYSGQCYMSFEATRRGANRGECAQFCRLPYTLKDENGNVILRNKHLLSPKDLNLSNRLNELIDAGVTSFKIEGRLKDENYVKNVVSYYRKALDEILKKRSDCKKSSFGTTDIPFVPNLEKSFNRGFTEYFIDGKANSICSMDTPKSKGEYLGKISKIGQRYFEIDNKSVHFHNGDGLCFLNKDGIFTGLNINRVDGEKIFPNQFNGLVIGTSIYRNLDFAFEKQVANDTSIRQIHVELSLRETSEQLELSGITENGIQTSIPIPKSEEQARDEKKNLETIQKQLEKSGGTIFNLSLKTIDKTGISGYYPISVLNQLRRDFLDKLLACIEENYPKSVREKSFEHPPYPLQTLTYRHNVSNKLAMEFYKRCGVQSIESAFELQQKPDADLMTTRYCLRKELGICLKSAPNEELTLTTSSHIYALSFDCAKCEMRIRRS